MAKLSWWGRAVAHSLKAGDEETAAEMIEEKEKEQDAEPTEPPKSSSIEERLDALEKAVMALVEAEKSEVADEEKKEEPDEDCSESMKTCDIAALWQETKSLAEILYPGNAMLSGKIPADRKQAADEICKCRRAALDQALRSDRAEIIKPIMGGIALDSMSADARSTAFFAAAQLVKSQNNMRQYAGDAGVDSAGELHFNPRGY